MSRNPEQMLLAQRNPDELSQMQVALAAIESRLGARYQQQVAQQGHMHTAPAGRVPDAATVGMAAQDVLVALIEPDARRITPELRGLAGRVPLLATRARLHPFAGKFVQRAAVHDQLASTVDGMKPAAGDVIEDVNLVLELHDRETNGDLETAAVRRRPSRRQRRSAARRHQAYDLLYKTLLGNPAHRA